jgi:hypothetical protein
MGADYGGETLSSATRHRALKRIHSLCYLFSLDKRLPGPKACFQPIEDEAFQLDTLQRRVAQVVVPTEFKAADLDFGAAKLEISD